MGGWLARHFNFMQAAEPASSSGGREPVRQHAQLDQASLFGTGWRPSAQKMRGMASLTVSPMVSSCHMQASFRRPGPTAPSPCARDHPVRTRRNRQGLISHTRTCDLREIGTSETLRYLASKRSKQKHSLTVARGSQVTP